MKDLQPIRTRLQGLQEQLEQLKHAQAGDEVLKLLWAFADAAGELAAFTAGQARARAAIRAGNFSGA